MRLAYWNAQLSNVPSSKIQIVDQVQPHHSSDNKELAVAQAVEEFVITRSQVQEMLFKISHQTVIPVEVSQASVVGMIQRIHQVQLIGKFHFKKAYQRVQVQVATTLSEKKSIL